MTEDLDLLPGTALPEALSWAAVRLQAAAAESPRREARLLLAAALSTTPLELLGDRARAVSGEEAARFAALIARRRAREPLSRILGRREFWSRGFTITEATLDPRPDSETLVEALLARLERPGAARRILDLGTGSGCLLLALLGELPGAWGLGVDIAPRALAAAGANAAALGLAERAAFAACDWGAALAGTWDVIVCNPPYVASGDIDGLAPEVARFDPRAALDGGADGLACYRRVVPELARLLTPRGLAALEIGSGQGDAVAGLLESAGLGLDARVTDLAGIARCLVARRAPGRSKAGPGQKGI